ncbi:hypothetical protein Ahy_B05g076716 isoform A [Arachis hypogaea]|uniref:Aminotransferase-like plant mobile domain-containing protein n=1 Tax=Arachis hypogaea TaxID=3818 RepID=A0A444Z440_ARAHY|nr:hypothetical protein Ahy_B05g076716 isoform A [Arachis hypogaea]
MAPQPQHSPSLTSAHHHCASHLRYHAGSTEKLILVLEEKKKSLAERDDMEERGKTRLVSTNAVDPACNGELSRPDVLPALEGSMEIFSELPLDADEEIMNRFARVYIMMLLSTQLFGDKFGTCFHIWWLPYLARLNDLGRYSWESPVLAWLY